MRVIYVNGPRQEDQTARRINFITKCHSSVIYKTLVKWFLVRVTLADRLRDGLVVLRVYTVGMDLAKEMFREEYRLSFAKKRSCVWQTHSLERRRGK